MGKWSWCKRSTLTTERSIKCWLYYMFVPCACVSHVGVCGVCVREGGGGQGPDEKGMRSGGGGGVPKVDPGGGAFSSPSFSFLISPLVRPPLVVSHLQLRPPFLSYLRFPVTRSGVFLALPRTLPKPLPMPANQCAGPHVSLLRRDLLTLPPFVPASLHILGEPNWFGTAR